MGAMMRWLVVLLTLYVSADLANPLMPGAVVFDAGASVDLRGRSRVAGEDDVTPPASTPLIVVHAIENSAPPASVPRIVHRPSPAVPHIRPSLHHPPSRDDEPFSPSSASV